MKVGLDTWLTAKFACRSIYDFSDMSFFLPHTDKIVKEVTSVIQNSETCFNEHPVTESQYVDVYSTHINHTTFIDAVEKTIFRKFWQTLPIKFVPWSSPLIWECFQTQSPAGGTLCFGATVQFCRIHAHAIYPWYFDCCWTRRGLRTLEEALPQFVLQITMAVVSA